MAVDKLQFRDVVGRFAAGVTVVTTVDGQARPYGLTVTAFCSVSLEPPLVLVCVDKGAETYPHFAASGRFAVNFLAADQRDLSQRFATSGGDKFAGVAWRPGRLGLPLLAGTVGVVECRIVHAYAGGDHTIYVGEVERAEGADRPPLLHFRGDYARLVPAD